MSELKTALFSDKLRGFVTLVLLVLILCLVLISWLFPKQSDVSEQTLTTLQQVANQMEKVGNNIERANLAQEKRNQLLESELQLRKTNRDHDYDGIYQKWGQYNPGTGNELLNDGLRQQGTVDEGSRRLSSSTGGTSKDQQLP